MDAKLLIYITQHIDILKLLLSSFIGAIFAYFLNFNLQKRLTEWKEKIEEQKLAYLYLIRIGQMISIFKATKKILNILIKDKIPKKNPSEEFDLSHSLCVIISKRLETSFTDGFLKNQLPHFQTLEKSFSELFNYELKDEFLLKFSKKTFIIYQEFRQGLTFLKQSFVLLETHIEIGRPLDAHTIYSIWKNLLKTIDYAQKLWSLLTIRSNISDSEAKTLLENQETEVLQNYLTTLFDEKKIEKASEAYKKEEK